MQMPFLSTEMNSCVDRLPYITYERQTDLSTAVQSSKIIICVQLTFELVLC